MPLSNNQILFTPGPVGVKDVILKKLSEPLLFHRTKPFEKAYSQVSAKLSKIYGADDSYSSLILTGSGTMANESVIISLIKDKQKLLIVSNGQFGERLADIAKLHRVNYKILDFGWSNIIELNELEKQIIEYKPDWVFVTLLETSTGIVNPVHEIGKLCKIFNADLFVDAVSGLGSEPISMIQDNISACTSVPNKALEGPPGLSFVCVKKNLLHAKDNVNSYYLDLSRYYTSSLKNQTPTTPALSVFVSLNKALELLLQESVNSRRRRYRKLSNEVINLCKDQNIPILFAGTKHKAVAINTLVLRNHDVAEKLSLYLFKKGMTVWHHDNKQKNPTMNGLVQVSVMGDINISKIRRLFKEIAKFNNHGKK